MSQEVLKDGSPVVEETPDEKNLHNESPEAFRLRMQKETDAHSEELTQASGLEIVRKKLEKLLTTKTTEEVIKIVVIALILQGVTSISVLLALGALIKEGCTAEENLARAIIAIIIGTAVPAVLFAISNWIVTHTGDK